MFRGLFLLAAPAAASFSAESLYADVLSYTASGEHRTGTRGLARAMGWMSRELETAGFEVKALSFEAPRAFDVESCSLTVGRWRPHTAPCWPVWPPKAVELESVQVSRRAADVAGKLFVMESADIGLQGDVLAAVNSAVASGASGVVLVAQARPEAPDVSELPVALNRDVSNVSAWPVPVVLVGGSLNASLPHDGVVNLLSVKGQMAKNTTAQILHARLPNPKAEKAIVIELGLSGWHVCGGERGPGVALGLALARRAARSNVEYHVFVTAGHEFGASFGLPDFFGWLADNGLAAERVALWLHTGSAAVTYADFDAAGNGSGKQLANSAYQANNPLLASCVPGPLTAAGYSPEASSGGGGVAELLGEGYPALGFWGDFPRFHRSDDNASSVGPELLYPVAKSLAAVVDCVDASLTKSMAV